MNKRSWAALLCIMLMLPLCAQGAQKATDVALNEVQGGVSLSFACQEEYVYVAYASPNATGAFLLEGQGGRYETVIPAPVPEKTGSIKVTLYALGMQRIGYQELKRVGVPSEAPKDMKGATKKVEDLAFSLENNMLSYSFTALGREAVVVQYSSVSQKGQVTASADENGVFRGAIPLPYPYARDLITVTLKTRDNVQLAKAAQRVPFVAPEAAAVTPGALSGVTVCIDPGHQALEIKVKSVPNMPGSDKYVASGSTGMAQGVTTFRKESIVALEISYKLANALRRMGAQVLLTRTDEDTVVDNMERVAMANDANADFFVRIHLNYRSNDRGKAVDVYIPKSSPYAQAAADKEDYISMGNTMLKYLKEYMNVSEGLMHRSDQFVGNNWAKMPVFLIEAGYMSTPKSDLLASYPPYQEQIALGLAMGLQEIVENRR